MKKILTLLFGFTICTLNIHSQGIVEPITLDTVKIRCLYQESFVMDTTNTDKKTIDIIRLDIGKKISKYHNHDYDISLSIARKMIAENKSESEVAQFLINSKKRDYSMIQIYKNYPDKGLLLFSNSFGFATNIYEEPVPQMQWQLKNDTATVCGYLCKKAKTTFGGRDYTVWYAPEIPSSEGPWKFNGLPGLILKVDDEQSYFSFICQSIEFPKNVEIITVTKTIKEKKRISKTAYEKAIQSYMDNSGAYMSGNPLLKDESLPAHNYQKKPYNPIERPEK